MNAKQIKVTNDAGKWALEVVQNGKVIDSATTATSNGKEAWLAFFRRVYLVR